MRQNKTKWFFVVVLFFLFGCATGGQPKPKTGAAGGPPPALEEVWKDPDKLFKEAQKSYDASNFSLSLTAVQRILTAYPKSDVYAEAKKLEEELQNRLGNIGFKIGVLLPLTGSFARFGESTLDGIACAISLFDPCGGTSGNVQIVVRDTQGNPNLIALALKELVEKEKVSAVIGPLLSAEATPAATQAQALHVPMIVLSPQEGVTQSGDFIFQHSPLAENEVQALLQQALKAGLKKFAILYPKNRYGEQYKNLFTAGVEAGGGGKIIALSGYAPDIPDFTGIVEQLTKKQALAKALETKQGSKLGIFIPDSYKQVLQIAQALDGLSIQGPRLIGTSRWNHPQLLTQASLVLDGAIIDTPFFVDANREATRKFSDSFSKAYGNSPAWLEAFGYDATAFILYALGAKGSEKPLDIRDSLLTLQNFSAVVGPVSFDAQRVSQWPLDLVTIHEGKFSPLK